MTGESQDVRAEAGNPVGLPVWPTCLTLCVLSSLCMFAFNVSTELSRANVGRADNQTTVCTCADDSVLQDFSIAIRATCTNPAFDDTTNPAESSPVKRLRERKLLLTNR